MDFSIFIKWSAVLLGERMTLWLKKTLMNLTYRMWERKEDILCGSIYRNLHGSHSCITFGRWGVKPGGPRWPSGVLRLNMSGRYTACSCWGNSTSCALMIDLLRERHGSGEGRESKAHSRPGGKLADGRNFSAATISLVAETVNSSRGQLGWTASFCYSLFSKTAVATAPHRTSTVLSNRTMFLSCQCSMDSSVKREFMETRRAPVCV